MNNIYYNLQKDDGSGSKKMLLTIAFIILSLLIVQKTCAQSSNQNHLQISAGLLYERGVDLTLAVSHETRYHNAWEFFANGYVKYEEDPEAGHITKDSFWNSYRTWLLGVAYKPCIARGRNHHGNLRIGAVCGSDTHKFIGGGTVGYEHSYALYHSWEFFFQVRCDILARAKDVCRTGVELGIKVPL